MHHPIKSGKLVLGQHRVPLFPRILDKSPNVTEHGMIQDVLPRRVTEHHIYLRVGHVRRLAHELAVATVHKRTRGQHVPNGTITGLKFQIALRPRHVHCDKVFWTVKVGVQHYALMGTVLDTHPGNLEDLKHASIQSLLVRQVFKRLKVLQKAGPRFALGI